MGMPVDIDQMMSPTVLPLDERSNKVAMMMATGIMSPSPLVPNGRRDEGAAPLILGVQIILG